MIRGRFAPTPSGQLHIGNARTALLAWLQIRQAGGQFVLRMEDIDKPRSRPELARQILEDLRWLGLDWDEGPDVDGPYGPYTQSCRLELYQAALEKLKSQNRLYPCYCSRAELMSIASAPHGLDSEGPAYPGTCRRLSAEQRLTKSQIKTPSLRFSLPDRELQFHDAIAGYACYPAGAGGDFVVQRADGIFGYQLAVVVDDAAMKITDVVRGADLLDSTPRQIWLYEALGYTVPRFAHSPLLYGPEGKRLSKRHGSVTVAGMRAAGTSPERIIGCLAYWSGLMDRLEPIQAAELVAHFSIAKIAAEPLVIEASVLASLAGSSL
ncbi:tRNA glutamyl-Q(34) synthetase GluQRS [Paenibacillus thalictri]|uniref:Glutamyl-Q tRNA(Asp) synthetase n=1 Tax=Paenibacillus thalictri TaxID=2527873 RepID=A0A4Q9DQF2_9BACL|nr:tRNA glutamyl-Q(34) synthetase GluQRS [Paenibacillus thalictri]TBL77813.1 tRNA glutamyl-Q(34) synthetase GluQRS [Paenibacillus thalictri]